MDKPDCWDGVTPAEKLKYILFRFTQDQPRADKITEDLLPFLNLLHPGEGKRVTGWDPR